jgi:hypothetical protein
MGITFITRPVKKNVQQRLLINVPEDFHDELERYWKGSKRIKVTVETIL